MTGTEANLPGGEPREPASVRGPSEVTGRRLLHNTLINGLASLSGAGLTLLLTPFLLHRLGPEQYGLWLLATTLTFSSGYLALADLGLPEAAVRFIAESRASGMTEHISEIASTATAVFVIVAAVAGGSLALLATVFVRLFGISRQLAGPAHLVFVLMALEILVDMPAAGLLAVIEGAQRYSWLRGLDVGGRVTWAVAVLFAVSRGHGVEALAVTALCVAAAQTVAAIAIAHRVQPGLRLRPRLVTRATLRQIFSYGSTLAAMRILSVVYAQMDRAIVGIALAAAAVARYEIAYRITSVGTLVLSMASSSIVPAAAYSHARDDAAKQRDLYLRGTKYAVAVVVPVSVAAMVYARQLIVAWVGAGYASMAGPTRLFLLYPAFVSVHSVALAMMVGIGRMRRVLVLNIVSVALNLVLSIALASAFGISGVIMGTLVGYAVIWLPYTRLFLSTFEVRLSTWFRQLILPNLPGPALQIVVGVATLSWVERLHELWQIGLVCGASCALSAIVFCVIGLQRDELRQLVQILTPAQRSS